MCNSQGHRLIHVATLICAALCLTGCASQVDYAPKTQSELDQAAQEHRVFYEGWGRQHLSEQEKDVYYGSSRGLN